MMNEKEEEKERSGRIPATCKLLVILRFLFLLFLFCFGFFFLELLFIPPNFHISVLLNNKFPHVTNCFGVFWVIV